MVRVLGHAAAAVIKYLNNINNASARVKYNEIEMVYNINSGVRCALFAALYEYIVGKYYM